MKIIHCDRAYASQILAIFNEAIVNSTALYDYQPRSAESMIAWFDVKDQNNFPVVGIVDELTNKLLAFGSYGTFRAWPAYKYTVEHSLYVEKHDRGKGLGKVVLSELIKYAGEQEYHCMMAGIDSMNEVSIALHQRFGFNYCGRVQQVGYKFNRWLDLDFYQLLLSTPHHPIDG
jgi:L-amino acid N-acyltransferase